MAQYLKDGTKRRFHLIKYMYNYQTVLQTPPPNTSITQRFHSAHAVRPQRSHDALENPIALSHRPHSALSSQHCKRQAAAFSLGMFKII